MPLWASSGLGLGGAVESLVVVVADLGQVINSVCKFMFFFSSRRRHTRLQGDWSSDVCSSDLVYLYTRDGRKILDAISSWWVNLHGHANPRIAAAITEQARKLEHVILAGFTHEEIGRASCRERV